MGMNYCDCGVCCLNDYIRLEEITNCLKCGKKLHEEQIDLMKRHLREYQTNLIKSAIYKSQQVSKEI